LVILASVPLYRFTTAGAGWGGSSRFSALFRHGYLAGFTQSPLRLAVYWVVAVPVAYVVIAVFYWMQARRRRVSHVGRAYVLTGFGVFVVLCPLRLPIQGTTLLIAIALPLFVLARTERSLALLAFAVPFLAITVLANFRYGANALYRFGLGHHGSAGSYGPDVNAAVVGAVLLLAGVSFGFYAAQGRTHTP
jgi:hypothetical protein